MNSEEFEIEIHLKDLRKEHKLSQEELADKLGISRQSIIALEQGKSLPSLPLAFSMCRFFDSAFEDLFIVGQEIEEEMDRVFEGNVTVPKIIGTMPVIDIEERKDEIIVKAELPGMTEEETEVEIANGVMTISGEKSCSASANGEISQECNFYKESYSGAFSRSFALPADIKEEKAEAEMKNGVLTITIPKIAPKKATKIKLSSNSASKQVSARPACRQTGADRPLAEAGKD